MITDLPPHVFFGAVRERCQFDDLTLVEARYDAGLHVPPHRHVNASFYLLLDGACTEVCDRKARPVTASTLVFHPPMWVHEAEWRSGGGTCLNIEIPPAMLECARDESPRLGQSIEFRGDEPLWLGMRLLREFRHRDALSRLVLEGLAMEIVAAVARTPSAGRTRGAPAWLAGARELLHDRFTSAIRMQDIARELGVHPVHLCREFRRHFGCTMGDQIRRLRIDFAIDQLSHSRKSLAEIALAAGFADQSHFTRSFRRLTGSTPRAFRRSQRGT